MDFAADFVYFTDSGLKLVKLTISFHCTVSIQGGNINFFLKIRIIHKIHKICIEILLQPSRGKHLCETKDHFCLRS